MVNCFHMESFSDWLERELAARGMRPADLARLANIGDATLSRILSESRNAGPDVCLNIAQAFELPPEMVFRQAGLLPPATEITEEWEELLYIWKCLSPGERQIALRILRSLARLPQRASHPVGEQDLRSILDRATIEQLAWLSNRLSTVIESLNEPQGEMATESET